MICSSLYMFLNLKFVNDFIVAFVNLDDDTLVELSFEGSASSSEITHNSFEEFIREQTPCENLLPLFQINGKQICSENDLFFRTSERYSDKNENIIEKRRFKYELTKKIKNPVWKKICKKLVLLFPFIVVGLLYFLKEINR